MDRYPRPLFVTLLGIFDLMAAIPFLLAGAGLVVLFALEKETVALPFAAIAFLVGLALAVAGIGAFRLSAISRTLHLVLAFPALLLLPLGTLWGAAVLVFMMRPGAKVLFGGRGPSDVTPEEDQAVAQLSSAGAVSVGLLVSTLGLGIVAVPILAIIAAIAIPNFLSAVERGKQKRTIADMRSIRVALEAYAADASRYPVADTLETLEATLSPKYIAGFPAKDGWDRPLSWTRVGPEGRSYVLRSAGKDGVFEEQDPEAYVPDNQTTYFDCDIVLRDGLAVRLPNGVAQDIPLWAPPVDEPDDLGSPAPEELAAAEPTPELPLEPEPTEPAVEEATPEETPVIAESRPAGPLPTPARPKPSKPTSPASPGAPRKSTPDIVDLPFSQAKLLTQVKPVYPAIAKKAGVSGIVILEAIIGTDGSVQEVKVLRSVPLLDQAAIDAVKQWTFEPAKTEEGEPVRMRLTVTMQFNVEK